MNSLIWHNQLAYDTESINKKIKFIKKNLPGLIPLYFNELKKLNAYAHKYNISIHEMIALRNLIKVQKEIYASRNIDNDKIKLKFHELVDQIKLNMDNISSLILEFYKNTWMPIGSVLKLITKTDDYNRLNHDELKKLYQIVKDNEISETDSRKRAADFEIKLANWIRANSNVSFKTEDELKLTNNHLTSTPDILFDEPVNLMLDGIKHEIYWIDAKNYILADFPFIIKKLKQQAAKYNNEFGSGAFVFHYGFDKNIKIPNTLILDGKDL
jgi:hypothetical protein